MIGGMRLSPGRLPVLLRRRADVILAISVAFLAAAILGVLLGRSAIAEINPVHFRGEAARPRGIDPNAAAPARDSYASAYGFGDGFAARSAACGGDCDAREAREPGVFSTPVRTRPAGGPYWRDATPVTEPRPWPPGDVGPAALSVERYMHYPVEASAETAAEVADDRPEGAKSSDE